jgi:hypothetical protein
LFPSNRADSAAHCAYAVLVAYEWFKRRERKMIDFTPPRAASRSVLSGTYLPLGEGLFLFALLFIAVTGI